VNFSAVVISTAQPPGVPEICKKSLSACPCTGGMELFVLGKNFLKDTRVVFQDGDAMLETTWEESVQPDKEFLQQACGLSCEFRHACEGACSVYTTQLQPYLNIL